MMKESEEMLHAEQHEEPEAQLVPVILKIDDEVVTNLEDNSFSESRIRCSSLEESLTSKKNSTASSKRLLQLSKSHQTSSDDDLAKCCSKRIPSGPFDQSRRMSKRQRKNSEIYVKQYREWKLSQNYPSISSQRTTVTQLSKDRTSSTRSCLNNYNLSPQTQSGSASLAANRAFRPNDYLFFSIFTTLFCFFPIGIISLYFSIKSAQSYHLLQLDESVYYSKLAFKLNLAAFFTGIVFFVFCLLSFFIILGRALAESPTHR